MTLWWALIILSAAWVGFTYAGYPLALSLMAYLSPRPIRPADISPPVSVIIAVYNGEAHLQKKLEDTLALEYPGPVEIIVASDGSTDGTVKIAERFATRGVRLVQLPERAGKETAQAAAIGAATGDVLAFSDVTAELDPSALRAIVRPLADPTVGSVSSEDRVVSEGGEGAYVRFEMALRRLENRASTLVGLSGSFFAIRRDLGTPWPYDLASDFRMALETTRRGLRAVSEPTATARFRASDDSAREWSRKVRTVRRGLAVLASYRDLLSPRFGRAAFSLWGHKVARFTSPFALIVLFIASAAAAPASPVAMLLFLAQLGCYGFGGLSLFAPLVAEWRPARLGGFFLIVNASMLVAWAYHLSGRRAVLWEPTRR